MIGRSFLATNLVRKSLSTSVKRQLHKGTDSTPPMRYMPIYQKIALYFMISGVLLSYPTYVFVNIDNLRPRPDYSLSSEVVEQIDVRKAARNA